MHLIVGATPYANWTRFQPLLEHLGFRSPGRAAVERWKAGVAVERMTSQSVANAELVAAAPASALIDMSEHPSSLSGWLRATDDTRLLLLHTRPEIAITRAVAQGLAPSAALRAWLETAEELLAVYRHARARSLMISVEPALASPNLCLKTLQQCLGIKVGPLPEQSLQPPESLQSDLQSLIAAQLVAQDDGAVLLVAELEAGSHPIGDPEPPPVLDCDAVWEAEQVVPEETAPDAPSTREHEELKEENELLLAQLHQVQEELERYYLAYVDTNSKPAATSKARASTEITSANSPSPGKAKTELQAVLSSASWRITGPLRWLASYWLGPATSLKPAQIERYSQHQAEEALESVLGSLSWRVTTPLRWVAKPIVGPATKKAR